METSINNKEETKNVFTIAREEWVKIYPESDLITMSERERDFAWEHWLRAFQIAQKIFK